MMRLHALVTGKVQEVGYRAFTLRHARALGLTGWVRNRLDGSVEVTAEGEKAALAQLRLHLEAGPILSRVEEVTTTESAATGEFSAFDIAR